MNILAIRFARLGDTILLMPALAKLKSGFPHARLTFLTGHRCAPIAEMCPAIDDIISLNRVAIRDGSVPHAIASMAKLVRDVRRRKFDLVIDFHGFRETNLLTWASGAPQRLGLQRFDQSFLPFCFNLPPVVEDKSLHVSQMFDQVVESLGVRGPSPLALSAPAGDHIPDSPAIVLYIDAPAADRIWPPERFAAVADHAIDRFGVTITVLAGPGPEGAALTRRVQDAASNGSKIRTFSTLSIPQVAAIIASAKMLISNDTGPMHLGPAFGVPTLGLFSVGLPEHFRPRGANDHFLRGNPIEKIAVEDVAVVIERMWATAGYPDLRR